MYVRPQTIAPDRCPAGLIAGIYAFAAERLTALTRRWVPLGLAYGIVVFVVTSFVVQPLSAAPNSAYLSVRSAGLNLVAMMVFGLIAAATTRQMFKGRP